MRVLVIDDDDSLRSMVSELLIEIGYELVGFATIDEAADNASFSSGRADLILIDVEARHADEVRASIAAAVPRATVIDVRDGEYESIPRARRRDRKGRARATQPRAIAERVLTTG